ncbi:unnamed protein product [Plutella xylostella]|uniref:(diamondback moth) hypothetical protein n=1 Tax=Plutella xylostella TaxID=51655 RepID=A0A8S4G5F6_PLUXY|nr:unnamed protein product [Plutella xylostella]
MGILGLKVAHLISQGISLLDSKLLRQENRRRLSRENGALRAALVSHARGCRGLDEELSNLQSTMEKISGKQ